MLQAAPLFALRPHLCENGLFTPFLTLSSRAVFVAPQMSYSLTRFAIYETVRDMIGSTSQGPMPFYQKVLLGAFGGRERTDLASVCLSYCHYYFLLSFAFGREEQLCLPLSLCFYLSPSHSPPRSLITVTEPNDTKSTVLFLWAHLMGRGGGVVNVLGRGQ